VVWPVGKLVRFIGVNHRRRFLVYHRRFKRISDLWYDEGFLYAVDSLNGRIQVLRVEVIEPETAVFLEEVMELERAAPADIHEQPAATETLPLEVPRAEPELEAAQSELEKLQEELEAAEDPRTAKPLLAEPAQVIDSPGSDFQE